MTAYQIAKKIKDQLHIQNAMSFLFGINNVDMVLKSIGVKYRIIEEDVFVVDASDGVHTIKVTEDGRVFLKRGGRI